MTTVTSAVGDRWVALGDVVVQTTRLLNLRNGELRKVVQNQIRPQEGRTQIIGLRRFIVEDIGGGNYRDTGEELQPDPEQYGSFQDLYLAAGYIHDPPHPIIDRLTLEDEKAAMVAKLTAQMAHYPFKFEITALQRRLLWYFNNNPAQKLYQTMSFMPDRRPYTETGELSPKYKNILYTPQHEAARAPLPRDMVEAYGGDLHKCLYRGYAWVVRFTLDGTDMLPNCRAYVDDEGTFICSDWCQRHDYTSYGSGVNLQMGIYNLAGWITGSCIQKVGFRPKSAKVEVIQIREQLRSAPVLEDFQAHLERATEKVKAALPKDALPIVPDELIPDVMTREILIDAEAKARLHYSEQVYRAMKLGEQREMLEALREHGKADGGLVELPLADKGQGFVTVTRQGNIMLGFNLPNKEDRALAPSVARIYRITGNRARAEYENVEFFWCSMAHIHQDGAGEAVIEAEYKKVVDVARNNKVDDPTMEKTPGWWLGVDEEGKFYYGGANLKLIDGIEPCFPGWHGYLVLQYMSSHVMPCMLKAVRKEEANVAAG